MTRNSLGLTAEQTSSYQVNSEVKALHSFRCSQLRTAQLSGNAAVHSSTHFVAEVCGFHHQCRFPVFSTIINQWLLSG